ncbi:hypothetical protein DSO57_1030502 [Entomophthora muscae]|uniref:Uncharacterized protein n=1 Tax=Entomophthora muscae TaxID=34485 RepID=A0ACC2TCD1_9FUNG|nr:hypothetical protein DSO57_1030502 [Entomophthora muscae]
MDNSDVEDPDAYGYSVLAVHETITVPYKLHSGKTTTTAKPLPEAKEVVSCTYLTQAKRSPVLIKTSEEAAEVVGYCKLLNAPDVLSLHPFGTIQDFNLPKDESQVLSLFTNQDFLQLSLVQQKEVLDLLDQFLDIFAKNSTDYGLAKVSFTRLILVILPPFVLNPTAAVKWRMLRCLKSSNNF